MGLFILGFSFLKHLEEKSTHTVCSLNSKKLWKNAKEISECVFEKNDVLTGKLEILRVAFKTQLFNCNNGFKHAQHSTGIVCLGM